MWDKKNKNNPAKFKTPPAQATAKDCASACVAAAIWHCIISNFWNLFCFAHCRGAVSNLWRATYLARFGDLSGVLSAAYAQLLEATGIGQEVITEFRLIEAVALNFALSHITHKPALANWNQMINYCRTKIAEKNREEFHV